MIKHIATVVALGVTTAFVVVFFIGRTESKHLADVAPKVGMSQTDLLDMGPRIAAKTGATVGSSRRIIYLLACSGLVDKRALEEQASLAGSLSSKDRLTDREAVLSVLAQRNGSAGASSLKGC